MGQHMLAVTMLRILHTLVVNNFAMPSLLQNTTDGLKDSEYVTMIEIQRAMLPHGLYPRNSWCNRNWFGKGFGFSDFGKSVIKFRL